MGVTFNHFKKMAVVVQSLSHVQFFTTPWTVARHVPLSMGLSRQDYRNGLPFPSPGDLSDSGIKPGSSSITGRLFTIWTTRESPKESYFYIKGSSYQKEILCDKLNSFCIPPLCSSHSVMSDSATPWTVDCQAPLSMGFSRQEYWSGLSFPTPGDHPDKGLNPHLLHLLHP